MRNQSVLLAGVNDTPSIMKKLIIDLSDINIEPYYVYLHDMVPGAEHFRTTLSEAMQLSKMIQGITAGHNTPLFVCDLPGGGGKRGVFSYESYDPINGISKWKSPAVKPGKEFFYFDPISKLSEEGQSFWKQKKGIFNNEKLEIH